MLEGLNVFSVPGFSFLLLILLVGYFLVEVSIGKWYAAFFFDRHRNTIFDRTLHYIFGGIVLNIAMFGFTVLHPEFLKILTDLFNSAGGLSKALGFEKANIGDESQLVIFSIGYFIIITSTLGMIALGRLLCYYLWRAASAFPDFFEFLIPQFQSVTEVYTILTRRKRTPQRLKTRSIPEKQI